MPIDRGNVRDLIRAIAYDARGSRLGRVAQVFIDDRTDEPAWVAVDVTRIRGMRLLPLAGAGLKGRHLVIRAERSTVRSAPRIDLGDGQLSSQDESRLLEHYGLAQAGDGAGPQLPEHRPASPWPDDTERETAWERPVQPSHSGDDTQAMSPSWERPAAQQQTAEIPAANPSPAAGPAQAAAATAAAPGQGPATTAPGAGQGATPAAAPGPSQGATPAPPAPGPGATPALARDTAPTPVTPAPSTPRDVAARGQSAAAAQPSTAAPPTEAPEPTSPRADPDSQGSSPATQTR